MTKRITFGSPMEISRRLLVIFVIYKRLILWAGNRIRYIDLISEQMVSIWQIWVQQVNDTSYIDHPWKEHNVTTVYVGYMHVCLGSNLYLSNDRQNMQCWMYFIYFIWLCVAGTFVMHVLSIAHTINRLMGLINDVMCLCYKITYITFGGKLLVLSVLRYLWRNARRQQNCAN